MAMLKILLALSLVAIVMVCGEQSADLSELQDRIADLKEKLETMGCEPYSWEPPMNEPLEDQLEAYQEREEELQDEMEECMEAAEEEEMAEEEEEVTDFA